MEKRFIVLFVGFLLLVIAKSTALDCSDEGVTSVIKVNITCDDYLELFVDGILLGSGFANANQRKHLYYEITAGSHMVALKCHGRTQSAWRGGILGSFDNELVTGTSWKCTNRIAYGWSTENYPDDDWPTATSYGTNSPSTLPWGNISSISKKALWIWTNDNNNDVDIYCRHRLVPLCTKVKPNFFQTSDAYRDVSLKGFLLFQTTVASEKECGLRCGQRKTCTSFNLQYGKKHGPRICELNTMLATSNPESIIRRKGFQYFERVYVYD